MPDPSPETPPALPPPAAPAEGAPAGSPPPGRGRHRVLWTTLAVIGVLAVVVAVGWWLHARHYESTDDAFIDAHAVHVAPQVAGQILRVLVTDNQHVKAGDALCEIEERDALAHLHGAQAAAAQRHADQLQAAAQVELAHAQLASAQSELASATALATQTTADLTRVRRLQAQDPRAIAAQAVDQAIAQAADAQARLHGAEAQARAAQAQLAVAEATQTSAQAQLQVAQTQIDLSQLTLGYTRIVAPVDGHVTRLAAAVGDQAQVGQDLLILVPDEIWVTANFKETQLARLRPGQPVHIHIDAYPDLDLHGHVDSVQRGAGQAFALLPPENATGNYVKVVQRVPVKIVFDTLPDEGHPLGPGMSVRPVVQVQ